MLVILMAAISIARASLYSGAEEVGFYCQVFITFHDSEGRVRVPKWMNFRKTSKGGGEVIFNPKIYIADFGPL